jgi:hypothetical protein
MNKLIFQVGLLAFFVSIVVLSSNNVPLVETVSRSFVVFIIVAAGAVGILLMKSWAMVNGRRNAEKEPTNEGLKSANSKSTK